MSAKTTWNQIQLATRLFAMRRRCNLTQAALAERAGISRNTIVNLESCGDPKLSTLMVVSDAMQTPMHAWFLPEDEWRRWYDFDREQVTS